MSAMLIVGEIEIAVSGVQLTVRCHPDLATPAFVLAFQRVAPALRDALMRANEKWYGQKAQILEERQCS